MNKVHAVGYETHKTSHDVGSWTSEVIARGRKSTLDAETDAGSQSRRVGRRRDGENPRSAYGALSMAWDCATSPRMHRPIAVAFPAPCVFSGDYLSPPPTAYCGPSMPFLTSFSQDYLLVEFSSTLATLHSLLYQPRPVHTSAEVCRRQACPRIGTSRAIQSTSLRLGADHTVRAVNPTL